MEKLVKGAFGSGGWSSEFICGRVRYDVLLRFKAGDLHAVREDPCPREARPQS